MGGNVPGPGPQARLPQVPPGAPGPQAPPPGGPGGTVPGEQGASTALLRICDGDVDWIRVTMPPDTKKVATILFDHAKGDLDLAVFDEAGEKQLAESATSSPEQNAETVPLPEGKEERVVLLRVSGKPGAQNFYVLRLDTPQGNQGDQGQDEKKDENEDQKQDQKQDQQKDQQKDQKQDQDQKDQDQKDQDQQKQDQKKANPIEDAMDQIDRNPDNLEALEALRKSQFRNTEPDKDW